MGKQKNLGNMILGKINYAEKNKKFPCEVKARSNRIQVCIDVKKRNKKRTGCVLSSLKMISSDLQIFEDNVMKKISEEICNIKYLNGNLKILEIEPNMLCIVSDDHSQKGDLLAFFRINIVNNKLRLVRFKKDIKENKFKPHKVNFFLVDEMIKKLVTDLAKILININLN